MSVIQLLQQAIGQITYAVALAVQITTSLITSGWYIVVRDAAVVTTDIHDLLEDPTCGQSAQCAKLDTLISDVSTLLSDVAALGNPQQSGVAVTLPTTPPVGYGGASASAVWSFVLPVSGSPAGAALDNANGWAVSFSEVPWPRIPDQPFLKLITHFNWLGVGFFTPDPQPALDVSTILPSDATPADWVTRAYSSYGWVTVNQSANWQPLAYPDMSTANLYWALDMSQAEFTAIKQALFLLPELRVPPVWPGLANVTLGTPVAIASPGGTIAVPCDGVIVDITGVPSWSGSFQFGTAISWRNIGALSFYDDNGEQEFPQTWGFAHCVYTPQSMATASGLRYRAAGGVSGTLTPYTNN